MELFAENILDFAAIIILLLVLIYSKTQFSKDFESNKFFNRLVYSLIIFTVCDFSGTYLIAYAKYVPTWINYLNSSVLFLAEGATLIIFYKYVENYIHAPIKKTVAYYITSYFPALFAVECIVANCFVFILFEFGSYGYCAYGPLFSMLYYILVYYQILISLMLIRNRKRIKKRQAFAVISFMVTTLLMIIIQLLLLPEISLQPFGFAIAVLILMLSLETPDYQKLTSTLKALEAVREQTDKLENLRSFLFVNTKKSEIPIEYNYRKYIEEIYYSFRQQAADKRICYIIETDDRIPEKVIGDKKMLGHIVRDYLNNAINNTKHGKLVLKSSLENFNGNSFDIVLSVTDTNINLALEKFYLHSNGVELTAGKNAEGVFELSCRIPHTFQSNMPNLKKQN